MRPAPAAFGCELSDWPAIEHQLFTSQTAPPPRIGIDQEPGLKVTCTHGHSYELNSLPYKRQLVAVFDTGTFLARRWEEEDGTNLYHLPGDFFVEVGIDDGQGQAVVLRSFVSSVPLEEHAHWARLPTE
jgi:hypothetical protein